MMRKLGVILSLATLALFAQAAVAQQCCAPAGGDCGMQCCAPAACHVCRKSCGPAKVCKVVCETIKVKKYCWCVECEEFCAPLPACMGAGLHAVDNSCAAGACGVDGGCDAGCGGCDAGCGSCGGFDIFRDKVYLAPQCDRVRSRKVLVKKEYECEIPIYRCVVVCAGCCGEGCGTEGEAAPPAAPEPEAPPPAPAPTQQAFDAAPMPPL